MVTMRPDPARPDPVRRDVTRRPSRNTAPPRFVLGVDLGQVHDYTAACVVERTAPETHIPPLYEVRHLDRAPLGTSYPAVVAHVGRLMGSPELRERTRLVVDGTGVGRPVVDLLWQAGMRAVSVTITSGQRVTGGLNSWRVPKRDLVSNLQVLLQSSRLRIAADLPQAEALLDELLEFRVHVSDAGRDSWGAGRDHDDLVLALAIAGWFGERAMPRVAATPSGRSTERERRSV